MIHLLLFFMPILVLGILALIGFVGCNQVFGLSSTYPAPQIFSLTPTSGSPAGGTLVTITGINFDSVDKVFFGDAQATGLNMLSSSSMQVTTPPHAVGPVDVSPEVMGGLGTLQDGYLYDYVTHLQTVPNTAATGATQLSSSLPDFGGGKLIVAAVQWGGTASVSLSGAAFTQLEMDTLNPQQVAVFFAGNVSGAVDVIANLSAPSTSQANLLVSAYDFTGGNPDKQGSAAGLGTDASLPFQTSSLSPGDLVYSLVVARGPGSALAGTLSPGTSPAFTAESGQGGYLLLQDYIVQQADVDAGQITVSAVNSSGQANSKWYSFAMRIPHA